MKHTNVNFAAQQAQRPDVKSVPAADLRLIYLEGFAALS